MPTYPQRKTYNFSYNTRCYISWYLSAGLVIHMYMYMYVDMLYCMSSVQCHVYSDPCICIIVHLTAEPCLSQWLTAIIQETGWNQNPCLLANHIYDLLLHLVWAQDLLTVSTATIAHQRALYHLIMTSLYRIRDLVWTQAGIKYSSYCSLMNYTDSKARSLSLHVYHI